MNKKIVPTTMCNDCQVHQGFDKAMNGLENLLDYTDSLSKIFPRVIFTGHSLGGALATIAVGKINVPLDVNLNLITFGSPKVGNHKFVDFINKKVSGDNYRIKYKDDPITFLPSQVEYSHVGTLMWFVNNNEYKYKMTDNEEYSILSIIDHTKYPEINPKNKVEIRRRRRRDLVRRKKIDWLSWVGDRISWRR